MAIKIAAAGAIPAVDLSYVHFDKFNMAITRDDASRIAMSADVVLYGVDSNGSKHFQAQSRRLAITSIEEFIAGLDPSDQVDAMQALAKVQEGLGVLAEKYFGWQFEQVE